jgi:sec-independent protein translocase protein TatA
MSEAPGIAAVPSVCDKQVNSVTAAQVTRRITVIMGLSTTHLLLLLLVVVLLFGSGKISTLMGDVAKGIKSFKKGMAEEDAPTTPESPRTLDHDARATETRRDPTKSG